MQGNKWPGGAPTPSTDIRPLPLLAAISTSPLSTDLSLDGLITLELLILCRSCGGTDSPILFRYNLFGYCKGSAN